MAIVARDLTMTFAPAKGLMKYAVRSQRSVAIDALDGVNFSFERGEVVALTGHNGSGKSTLLRVLCSLLLPTRGTAEVLGNDVRTESLAVRRDVCFVPADDRSFSWPLSGRENLEFFAVLKGTPRSELKARVDDALERVNLTAAADDVYATYSSGMRQRLVLARALTGRSKVLLMDEPFRALDQGSSDALRSVITGVAAEGITVLAATHHLDELDGTWSRVLHLEHGVLTGDDVLSKRPKTPRASRPLKAARPKVSKVSTVTR